VGDSTLKAEKCFKLRVGGNLGVSGVQLLNLVRLVFAGIEGEGPRGLASIDGGVRTWGKGRPDKLLIGV